MKLINAVAPGIVAAAACCPGGEAWKQGVFHCVEAAEAFCALVAAGDPASGILAQPYCGCYA